MSTRDEGGATYIIMHWLLHCVIVHARGHVGSRRAQLHYEEVLDPDVQCLTHRKYENAEDTSAVYRQARCIDLNTAWQESTLQEILDRIQHNKRGPAAISHAFTHGDSSSPIEDVREDLNVHGVERETFRVEVRGKRLEQEAGRLTRVHRDACGCVKRPG